MTAWEDAAFVDAVRATGRRKLILSALWTEICVSFPALDALREAGGRPISCVALAGELQRDWARAETVDGLRQIVLTERLLQE